MLISLRGTSLHAKMGMEAWRNDTHAPPFSETRWKALHFSLGTLESFIHATLSTAWKYVT